MTNNKHGRPAGKKNTPVLERMIERVNPTVLNSTRERISSWLVNELDEDNKVLLNSIIVDCDEALARIEEITVSLKNLSDNKYEVPKASRTTVTFTAGTQIFIKDKFAPKYTKIYDTKTMNNLFVKEVVDGKVAVQVNKTGIAFYLPKSDLTTVQPVS